MEVDPAIAEIRAARAKLAEKCGGNVTRFGAMIAEEEGQAKARGKLGFVGRKELLETENAGLVFHDKK